MYHSPQSPRVAWSILFATSLSVILVFINSSGLAIALPNLSRELDATASETTWVLLSYMLSTTTLILVFGRVTDIVGRRRLYILGIVLFMIATLACGLATDAVFLIVMRFVQGIGAAAIITNTTALLTDVFPPRILSSALGINASIAAVGQVLGPLVGGLVTDLFDWRWIFLGGLPISLLGLIWSLRLIPDQPPRNPGERMDYPGSVLSVLAISLLVFGVSLGGSLGWSSPVVIGSFVAAGLVIIAFIVLQNRKLHPLIDISLFKDRVVSSLYISGFFNAISNYAIVLLASLYLQGVQGLSAIDAGVRILPVPIGTMVAAAVAGRLARTINPRWLTSSGMLLVSIGALLFAANLREDTPYIAIAVPLLLVGIGVGTFMTPNTTALMARVPSTRRGIANAIRSTLQNAGYLFSTALALAIATGSLTGAQQLAAYKGTLFGMKSHDLAAFVSGVNSALVLFGILALVGAIVSFAGTRGGPGHGPVGSVPGVVAPEL
jgi:EmrB/QacA subfamily drug resistance transporter